MKKNIYSILAAWILRESVCNESSLGAREAAEANAFSFEDGPDLGGDQGWFKVAPYGVFPGRTPGRMQHFGVDQARAIVEEFNSLLGRLGRFFTGTPIYRGHPDVDPTVWPDDRRLGKVVALEARQDGLWARADWNTLGRENLTEKFWVYPSPRWDAPAGRSRFEPDRLISIGLTNTPRIVQSEPIANSQNAEPTSDPNATVTDNPLMDPTILRQKLGLSQEATDEEVLAKIENITAALATVEERSRQEIAAAALLQQEKDALECACAAHEAAATSAHETAANAVLDLAEREGKITPATRPHWACRLQDPATREAAYNDLSNLRPSLNTKALGAVQDRGQKAALGALRDEVANAVAALQESRGMSYADAWCAVKKEARFRAYFTSQE